MVIIAESRKVKRLGRTVCNSGPGLCKANTFYSWRFQPFHKLYIEPIELTPFPRIRTHEGPDWWPRTEYSGIQQSRHQGHS